MSWQRDALSRDLCGELLTHSNEAASIKALGQHRDSHGNTPGLGAIRKPGAHCSTACPQIPRGHTGVPNTEANQIEYQAQRINVYKVRARVCGDVYACV